MIFFLVLIQNGKKCYIYLTKIYHLELLVYLRKCCVIYFISTIFIHFLLFFKNHNTRLLLLDCCSLCLYICSFIMYFYIIFHLQINNSAKISFSVIKISAHRSAAAAASSYVRLVALLSPLLSSHFTLIISSMLCLCVWWTKNIVRAYSCSNPI